MEPLFKTEQGEVFHARLEDEFRNHIKGSLRALLLELNLWFFNNSGKNLTVTCLYRNSTENQAVGGVPMSAHLTGFAADLRSVGLTDEEIAAILLHVKAVWGPIVYCIYHNSGSGPHIHLNINRAYREQATA